jgi:hypothetical protein
MDKEDWFKRFDNWGEDEVRARLNTEAKFTTNQAQFAREWVNRKDREKSSANERKTEDAEERKIALAQEANRVAKWALAVSLIAMLTSLAALALPLMK